MHRGSGIQNTNDLLKTRSVVKEGWITLAIEIFAQCPQAGADVIRCVGFAFDKFFDFHALRDVPRLRGCLDVEWRECRHAPVYPSEGQST